MTEEICLALAGAVLPDTVPAARRHVRPEARRSDHYLARYDRKTLFYDCVYQADRGGYLLTAPRFLNLWPEFRNRLRRDGAPVTRLRRRQRGKYEQVWVPGPEGRLSLDWPQLWPIVPRPDIARFFARLNAVVTVNKDNDLAWIRGWVRYHVEVHGLQAAVVFDNGSTAYSPEALAGTLAQVPGLQVACVLSAPYPYGPRDSGQRFEIRPKFLQPALLNLARTDILRQARAVLNADIDELVLRRTGPNVFDRAHHAWGGAVRLPGRWAYPAPHTAMPAGHGVHHMRGTPEMLSNPKWCARPAHGLSRLGWFVHHVGGEAFRLLPRQTACEFVHCRGTSTGWKGTRYRLPDKLRPDSELEALMARHFQEPAHP